MLAFALKRYTALSLSASVGLPCLRAHAATAKQLLNEKKKQAYQGHLEKKKQTPVIAEPEEEPYQIMAFESLLMDLARDIHQYLKFKIGTERVDLSPILTRTQIKMQNELKHITVLELLNYIEIVKVSCLAKLESLEDIVAVYQLLEKFIGKGPYRSLIKQFSKGLWKKDVNLSLQIRALVLLQFMQPSQQETYLRKITPLVQYFKEGELSVLFFEKHHFGFHLSYHLLDQIFQNGNFIDMDNINTSYLKMLFVQKIKGEFIPNEDAVFGKILSSIAYRPNIIAHTAFDKLVKILQVQGYFIQSENARYNLEQNLNAFINIAKNQNYGDNSINLHQLVGLYLGFEETNATGETLLSQITFSSRSSGFQLQKQNLDLYKQLLMSVLKNSEKKLKYERYDNLNKEYTHDTISFLEHFLPQYIRLWPEVILEVNQVGLELFPTNQKNSHLLSQFQQVFANISKKESLGLHSLNFTLKVLRFLLNYHHLKHFTIDHEVLETLLTAAIAHSKKQKLTNEQLQLVYLTLKLLSERCKVRPLKSQLSKFNTNYIQKEMSLELSRSSGNLVKTLDQEVIWLSLLSARCKSFGCLIEESVVEVFINEKLLFMLNSLAYEQVYQILVFVAELERLKVEVYERLLQNLSTFVIYINDQSGKKSPFYLNPTYQHLFEPICRLIIKQKETFLWLHNKEVLKVAQVMFVQNITAFSNADILNFLEVLGDAAYLNVSFTEVLKDIKFKRWEMDQFQFSSALKTFRYYNASLEAHFEGRSSEAEIRKKLKMGQLTQREIGECFSSMEVYKTIIMDRDINISFDMPEPTTKIVDFKYMYICQQIYKKIRAFNDFELSSQNHGGRVREVDLEREKRYMIREMLVVSGSENDFRIEERRLPKYVKMEVWKSFAFFDKNLIIEPRDLFFNNKKLTDQILSKVAKGVFGKFEKIREVVKEFACNENLQSALQEKMIPFQSHGAAFEFKAPGDGEVALTVLCTNITNFKILYICAYLMAKHGSKIVVLKEDDDVGKAVRFIQNNLPKQEQVAPSQQLEEEQEEQGLN